MKLSKYVACICEGGAEKTIIELLLDSNSLIFFMMIYLKGKYSDVAKLGILKLNIYESISMRK